MLTCRSPRAVKLAISRKHKTWPLSWENNSWWRDTSLRAGSGGNCGSGRGVQRPSPGNRGTGRRKKQVPTENTRDEGLRKQGTVRRPSGHPRPPGNLPKQGCRDPLCGSLGVLGVWAPSFHDLHLKLWRNHHTTCKASCSLRYFRAWFSQISVFPKNIYSVQEFVLTHPFFKHCSIVEKVLLENYIYCHRHLTDKFMSLTNRIL